MGKFKDWFFPPNKKCPNCLYGEQALDVHGLVGICEFCGGSGYIYKDNPNWEKVKKTND